MPCAYAAYTEFIDKLCSPGVSHTEQPRYQPVFDCIYLPVLGYFRKWDMIKLSNKSTPSEYFDKIHNIVLGRISDNMASLVQTVKHGSINTTYTKKGIFCY